MSRLAKLFVLVQVLANGACSDSDFVFGPFDVGYPGGGLPSFTLGALESVWGSSATDVFAVGRDILHYDGNTWRVQAQPGSS